MELQKEHFYTEEEYYTFEHTGLVEYDNGKIIAMSPPNQIHQEITGELFRLIANYLKGKLCKVFIAPFSIKLENSNRIVEPDISVICDKNKLTGKRCEGSPDLVIEVVSPSNMMHDYHTKLNWYKQANVKEYWIVNPMTKQILVYRFDVEDVRTYSFSDTVNVGIWDGAFSINFNEVEESTI